LPDCAVLLSALAHLGHPDVAAARAAFELGWPHLRVNTPGFELLPHSECTLDKIDSALNRLSEAVPHIKKLLLDAAAHTVSADGMINDNEAELLRAIADALDCPVPPFIQGVQPSA
ncbi:MAG: Zn-dependent protease with chaperone function, partial [Verrucomicrobiae bacterium]|nr:Zn-dependent protease with chaperone function [Verrucomicrobiae bacterium]